MIKKPEDLVVNKVEGLRGGKKTAIINHLIHGEELKNEAKMISVVSLEPGASIGNHDHTTDYEIYYILQGKGVVDDNGTLVEVNPGDTVYTCDGQVHSIENTGDTNLEFVAIVVNV